MHIAEGYLPIAHAAGWWLASTPGLVAGWRTVQHRLRERDDARLHLGASTGFLFVLSSLKLPSLAGSSSHPTGAALGALLLGPAAMAPLGALVLVFQTLLLAHGGFTTLGANIFSMAICGPWIAWGCFRTLTVLRLPSWLAVFAAGFFGDLGTYAVTAFQLALAYPDAVAGVWGSWTKFALLFGPTQLPLAVAEGVLTVLIWNAVARREDAAIAVVEGGRA